MASENFTASYLLPQNGNSENKNVYEGGPKKFTSKTMQD